MPKISIIVPVYNVEQYLIRCVDSILNQTFKDFELLLIDDGSTDESLRICNEYAKMDSRVLVFTRDNSGPGAARNYGIDHSSGDYIGFVDSDDYIKPDMYEILIENISKDNYDFSMIDFTKVIDDSVYEESTNEQVSIASLNRDDLIKLCCDGKYTLLVSCWSKLYKKDFLKNIRFPENRKKEDSFFLTDILTNVNNAVFITKKEYMYYQNQNGLEHKKDVIALMDGLQSIRDRTAKLSDLLNDNSTILSLISFFKNCYFSNLYKIASYDKNDHRLYIKALRKNYKKDMKIFSNGIKPIQKIMIFVALYSDKLCKKFIEYDFDVFLYLKKVCEKDE